MNRADGRLAAIAAHVPPAAVAADIGCDHGKLGELLLRERPELFVIAADISAPSLAKAAGRLSAGFSPERFETRLGDGLRVLRPGEADAIIIAGLGGRTICSVLRDGFAQARSAEHLLLAPHTCTGELRRTLAELDFRIECEWFPEDKGRFYPLLLAAAGGGRPESDPFWYEVGRFAAGDPAGCRYGKHLIRLTERALNAVGTGDPKRQAFLQARLCRLREEFA